jgi:hypothetical protein
LVVIAEVTNKGLVLDLLLFGLSGLLLGRSVSSPFALLALATSGKS